MRLNKYIATSTDLSRRAADAAINNGRVAVNNIPPKQGVDIAETDEVRLDGELIRPRKGHTTIILNKPEGYVCSRDGQGSHTIFELLPAEYRHLQPVGRLDKDSSGLLLLTDDGELANQLTHPRYEKMKIYEVTLDRTLEPLHQQMISDHGITLEDGLSCFIITKQELARSTGARQNRAGQRVQQASDIYQITMYEGRNRQIRRTLSAIGYTVKALHRIQFGSYSLGELNEGKVAISGVRSNK